MLSIGNYFPAFLAVAFAITASAEPLQLKEARGLARGSVVHLTVSWHDPENKENYCDVMTQGSAFIISRQGFALTAAHLLEIPKECGQLDSRSITGTVGFRNSPNKIVGSLVASEAGNDVALLSFQETGVEYVPVSMCSERTPDAFGKLFATGFPYDDDLVTLETHYQNRNGPLGIWVASSDFDHGMSGGPIFDARTGDVIGIIHGGKEREGGSAIAALRWITPIARGVNFINMTGEALKGCEQTLQCVAKVNDIEQCVQSRIEGTEQRTFISDKAEVRCPGGGCLFQSSDCNRRQTYATYNAPGGWEIVDYKYVAGQGNDAITGDVEVRRDGDGRISSVSASVACHPSSRPGADGGWNSGHFEGIIRNIFFDQLFRDTILSCEQELC